MTHIRKYTINAGNEIDYISTNIIDSKICIINSQINNSYCSKIINLDNDETCFISLYLDRRNKELNLATLYNPNKLSKGNDINYYFDILL